MSKVVHGDLQNHSVNGGAYKCSIHTHMTLTTSKRLRRVQYVIVFVVCMFTDTREGRDNILELLGAHHFGGRKIVLWSVSPRELFYIVDLVYTDGESARNKKSR